MASSRLCGTARISASAAGSWSHSHSLTPYSCSASSALASGSCTKVSTPNSFSSRRMSATFELRMSGTFSLKVSPSTLTRAPLMLRPAWIICCTVLRAMCGPMHVVDAPPGEDHLRVVAEQLRLVRQVVRVDADAVAADQPRAEAEEVPLGAGRLEHLDRVEAHLLEDDGELVDEGDVDVALRVLDHLGGLGHLDRGGAEHAGGDHRAVQLRPPSPASPRRRRKRLSVFSRRCAPCRRD